MEIKALPNDYKTVFMLNSNEHEIYTTQKGLKGAFQHW